MNFERLVEAANTGIISVLVVVYQAAILEAADKNGDGHLSFQDKVKKYGVRLAMDQVMKHKRPGWKPRGRPEPEFPYSKYTDPNHHSQVGWYIDFVGPINRIVALRNRYNISLGNLT